MDRNQVVGFSLLTVMLIVYMYFNTSEQKRLEQEKKAKADSTALAQKKLQPLITDSNTVKLDSASLAASPAAVSGQLVELKNDLLTVSINTLGGTPQKVIINKYKNYYKDPLVFIDGTENQLDLTIPFTQKIVHTKSLAFAPTATDSQLTLTANADGHLVQFIYTLHQGNYMMDFQVKLDGSLAPSQNIAASWTMVPLHTEQDIKSERMNSFLYHKEKESGDVDYYTVQKDKTKDYEEKMDWISVSQHFFNTSLIPTTGITNLKSQVTYSDSDTLHVSTMVNNFSIPADQNGLTMQWYYGPNDYNLLKKYNKDLEQIIPMGRGIFEFVKYVNRWMILPIFQFLGKFISNYGIIIMILTLLIRLLLSFFTYKSYLSQAKMKALKPELDELKAKFGGDQQKMSAEQMKLYQSAGVNPLGGCLPSLLQLPFLLAMYSFFPSSIELRQKSFLWAHDLSTYDSILSWTTHIPGFSSLYGNHISLFTILLTITSLILALQSSSMTDNSNPALKYMPYIMPIMFLGFFNNMAAGLTFYYFFSNLISIAQQWFIKTFVINHDKIRLQIEENKKKPASESKFAQKMAELQKQNEERKKRVTGK